MRSTLAMTTLCAAAVLVLSGCTITTYSSSDPPPKAAAPKNTATRKPARPVFRQGGAPTTRRTSATPTTTGNVAPRISSPIIFGNGTGGAFAGQAFVIAENTDRMPDLSSLVPFATLYTDSFNVQPQTFAGGFPGALVQEDWFAIRYEGTISLPKQASYQFKLTSDDGAILYIDGQKVIDNDGRHTTKTVTGQRELGAGAHRLRLDYFQAQKGPVALVLQVVEDGKERVLTGAR
jgi:hypothetical protein